MNEWYEMGYRLEKERLEKEEREAQKRRQEARRKENAVGHSLEVEKQVLSQGYGDFPSQYSGDFLMKLSGCRLTDPVVQELIKTLPEKCETHPDRLEFRALGISIYLTKAATVDVIQLHGRHPDFGPFPGQLPLGLTWDDGLRDVEAKLGPPSSTPSSYHFVQMFEHLRLSVSYCASTLSEAVKLNSKVKGLALLRRLANEQIEELRINTGHMAITKVVVFKAGARPSNESWYLQQVCESIGLPLTSLSGVHLDIQYVRASDLNQSYVVGYATQSGYDVGRCTLTPFADRDSGQGLVLKVMGQVAQPAPPLADPSLAPKPDGVAETAIKDHLETAEKGTQAVKSYLKAAAERVRAGCPTIEVRDVLLDAVETLEEACNALDSIPDHTPEKAPIEDRLNELAGQLSECGQPDIELRAVTAIPDYMKAIHVETSDAHAVIAASMRASCAKSCLELIRAMQKQGGLAKMWIHEELDTAKDQIERGLENLEKAADGTRWKVEARNRLTLVIRQLRAPGYLDPEARAKKPLDGGRGGASTEEQPLQSTPRPSQATTATPQQGSVATGSPFSACPNCGKQEASFGAALSLYRCGCGKVYCDHCSGGGLIDLPVCPQSPYHEKRSKVGEIQSKPAAAAEAPVVPSAETKIRFTCPSCQKSLTAPQRLVGKYGKCPKCGQHLLISTSAVPVIDCAPTGSLPSASLQPAQPAQSIPVVAAERRSDEEVKPNKEESRGSPSRASALTASSEAALARLSDSERGNILRNGTEAEKITLLKVLASHTGCDENDTLLAAIDSLAQAMPEVQQAAMRYLLAKGSLPATAWKLAYELRSRSVYKDELVLPQCTIIAAFEKTPALGSERARLALEFVRAYPLDATAREQFEERFGYFDRDEDRISNTDIAARSKDKRLCRQCGRRMGMTPQGPYVQLRCEHCDITRFEKAGDV